MSLPYFPMYPSDFEAKTSHLTLEEDGAYNRLLRLMWMTPGCSLPDDDAWIMRRMRVDAETYERVVRVILDEFCTRKNGRVSNAKLTRVFNESSEKHSRRVSAGSRGGKAKARKTKETSPSNAKAMLKQPEPEPKDSDTNVSGAAAPPDPTKLMFDSGIKLLCAAGVPERSARAILGKWRGQYGESNVLTAIGKASREGAIDPVGFMTGVLKFTTKQQDRPGHVASGAFGSIPERC